jgi:hypothetical protein
MSKKLSPLSLFSIRLSQFRNGILMGHGTGFLYKYLPNGETFLITNYHVLTARYPDKPALLLPGYGDSPDRLEFTLLRKVEDGTLPRVGGIDLPPDYEFLEHPRRADGFDIVAIKIKFTSDVLFRTQDELGLVEDIELEIGRDVFVIGFPFGGGAKMGFLPIWKRASIASEPIYLSNELPRFFVDTASRPGMSGSPVFSFERRKKLVFPKRLRDTAPSKASEDELAKILFEHATPAELADTFEQQVYRLVGIYSGRYEEPGKPDMYLGIVWDIKILEEMFTNPVVAKNPHPALNL